MAKRILEDKDALTETTAQKKGIVRELDEVKKGVYEAYVDEGATTYDVRIVVNAKGTVQEQSCDCKSPKPCGHIKNVLAQLTSSKKRTLKNKVQQTNY